MSAALPWIAGEYNPVGGYDCMTGAIRVGPVLLDAEQYGVDRFNGIDIDIDAMTLLQMQNDALLISSAHELLLCLRSLVNCPMGRVGVSLDDVSITGNYRGASELLVRLGGIK